MNFKLPCCRMENVIVIKNEDLPGIDYGNSFQENSHAIGKLYNSLDYTRETTKIVSHKIGPTTTEFTLHFLLKSREEIDLELETLAAIWWDALGNYAEITHKVSDVPSTETYITGQKEFDKYFMNKVK